MSVRSHIRLHTSFLSYNSLTIASPHVSPPLPHRLLKQACTPPTLPDVSSKSQCWSCRL